jgi:hypothetical protein
MVVEEETNPQVYLDTLLRMVKVWNTPDVNPEWKDQDYYNAWSDYWRYYIGVNVIPAIGTAKVPRKGCLWGQYQDAPIPKWQHDKWKQENAFIDGMAVIAGKVWHREDLEGYFFAGVDADNQKAIDELLSKNGQTLTVQVFSEKTIVDQTDDKGRIHFYIYTIGHQLASKTSDVGKPGIDPFQIPCFEIKASSSFLLYVAPNMHQKSGRRVILGSYTPVVLGYSETLDWEEHAAVICKRYGLSYGNGNGYGNGNDKNKIPTKDLFKDDITIYEGHNRHEALLRVMESMIKRNRNILSVEQIIGICRQYNEIHCKPPLDDGEFDKQWKGAVEFFTTGKGSEDIGNDKEDSEDSEGSDSKSGKKQEKLSSKVIKIIEPYIHLLFKDDTKTAFAAIAINGHREILKIHKSRTFDLWVRKVFYDENNGATLGNDVLREVTDTLQSRAIFSNHVHNLELRICRDPDDEFVYWYNLANEKHEAIRITSEGWSIVDSYHVPIMFRRRSGHLPQAYPSKDYPKDIFEQFLKLVNIKNDDEDTKLLLECYVICLVIPAIAKALLMVHGPQGAAKTALEDLIKSLIDPGVLANLTIPTSRKELTQQFQNNFLVYYDNLRKMPEWLSDDFCRTVTGTANSKRELYTDDDDIIFQYMRPIGFNGIPIVANKSDLVDRGLIIEVERITPDARRSWKDDIKPALERIRPRLLGFIFDTIVKVLMTKAQGGINLKSVSRMADFEVACETISRCLGNEDGKFTKAYLKNKNVGIVELIESSSVARAMIEFMISNGKKWNGTMTELLADLEETAYRLKINIQKDKTWPKAAHVLSAKLRSIKTDLEEVGIYITTTTDTKKKTKHLFIEKRAPEEPKEPENQDSRSESEKLSGSPSGSPKVEAPDEAPDKKPESTHDSEDSGAWGASGSSFTKKRGDMSYDDPIVGNVGNLMNNLRQAVDSRDTAWKSKASEAAEANKSGVSS